MPSEVTTKNERKEKRPMGDALVSLKWDGRVGYCG